MIWMLDEWILNIKWNREIVKNSGRDSEGREITGVCNTDWLLRFQEREGCIRRSTLPWIRGGSCLQCLPAPPSQPNLLPTSPPPLLPEFPCCFHRRLLPLRSTGIILNLLMHTYLFFRKISTILFIVLFVNLIWWSVEWLMNEGNPGHGGKRKGHDSLHGLFCFAEWHCRILPTM